MKNKSTRRKGLDVQHPRPLTVTVSERDVALADAAVLLGKACNRSQAVRQAIRAAYGQKPAENG